MLPISSDGNLARKVALITGITGQVSNLFTQVQLPVINNNYF